MNFGISLVEFDDPSYVSGKWLDQTRSSDKKIVFGLCPPPKNKGNNLEAFQFEVDTEIEAIHKTNIN